MQVPQAIKVAPASAFLLPEHAVDPAGGCRYRLE